MRAWLSLFIFPGFLLTLSCGTAFENARSSTEQKSGAGTGTVNLAMSLVRGTALSAIRQPLNTAAVGAAVIWQRPRELITGNLPFRPKLMRDLGMTPGTPGFEAELDAAGMPAAEMGKITWLVDGKSFFPEFERQIAGARQSIDVQVYIFDNDDIGVRLADKLKARSREIPVRVLFDDLGSALAWKSAPKIPAPAGFTPPDTMGPYLRESSQMGVRRMPNPFLVADHTKLHVFDSRVALLGCMNIGREYFSEWHDLMFRVEGPVVATLQEDFNRTWRKTHPAGIFSFARREPRPVPPPSVAGQAAVRVLRTDVGAARLEIRKAMLLAIGAAQKRIWFQNPYVSNDDITEALEAAAKRGVDVRMIIPEKSDSTVMDIANKAFGEKLIKAGGHVFGYPRMTHMKVMICDEWATVGSANLDTLSMRINRELNLSFNDPKHVKALVEKVFTPDFRVSTRRTLADPVSPSAPLVDVVADQL